MYANENEQYSMHDVECIVCHVNIQVLILQNHQSIPEI